MPLSQPPNAVLGQAWGIAPIMPSALFKNNYTQDGFTLLEMILVLFIIGIVSTVAIARIPSLETYNERMESDTLKSHLRYAQIRAMMTNRPWGIDFPSSSQYRLYSIEEAGTLDRYLPNATGHISLSALIMQANTSVEFDEMGSPGASAISVTTGAGDELFSVEAETGFIK